LLSSTYAFDLYHFLIWILWFILIVYRWKKNRISNLTVPFKVFKRAILPHWSWIFYPVIINRLVLWDSQSLPLL
jgi:hypothetical protein